MSHAYDFEKHRRDWGHPPVDDVGYLSSEELLNKPAPELEEIVRTMERTRYAGWRNHGNRWRECLGLDSTSGKRVLDFGCGIGLEALQFAPRNVVLVADIVPANVRLAVRVASLFGHTVHPLLVESEPPYFEIEPVDVFYANGVLHHIPYAESVLRRAAEIAGEIRLMLYSDRGWTKYVGEPLPAVDADVREAPGFPRFVRAFDQVGDYADWYSEEKIRSRFGSFLRLESFNYITDDERYCVAILRPIRQ